MNPCSLHNKLAQRPCTYPSISARCSPKPSIFTRLSLTRKLHRPFCGARCLRRPPSPSAVAAPGAREQDQVFTLHLTCSLNAPLTVKFVAQDFNREDARGRTGGTNVAATLIAS